MALPQGNAGSALLGEFLADAAEGLGSDSEVRRDLVLRHPLDKRGVGPDERQVAGLGGIAEEGVDAVVRDVQMG